jgi:hypothetical protein
LEIINHLLKISSIRKNNRIPYVSIYYSPQEVDHQHATPTAWN